MREMEERPIGWKIEEHTENLPVTGRFVEQQLLVEKFFKATMKGLLEELDRRGTSAAVARLDFEGAGRVLRVTVDFVFLDERETKLAEVGELKLEMLEEADVLDEIQTDERLQ